jgi:hypothetical protein
VIGVAAAPAATGTVAERAPVAPPSMPGPSTLPPVVASAPPEPVDCSTTSDRVTRIAKPGLLAGVLGAGLGAVSGAISGGGKSAGKGAAIGGIAGAALGSAYGAYRTKQECGTILGGSAR